jgi:two-component system, cell cycle response regulator
VTLAPQLTASLRIRAPADAFLEEAPRRAARPAATISPPAVRALGLAVPLACAALVLLDVDPLVAAAVPAVSALALALPLVVARIAGRRALLPDALGPLGLVLGGLVAAVALTGAGGPFVALALAVAVAEGAVVPGRRLALALPSGALALAGALVAAGAPPGEIVADALLLLGFGMLGRALFFGTLKAVQMREEARVDGELLRLYDDARLFGLVGSAEPGDDHAAEKRLVAQTLAVRDGCYRLLRLGARALAPDAAALYLLDATGKELVLKEQLLDVDGAIAARISAAAGAPGLAVKRRQAIRLLDAEGPGVQVHRRGARSVLCAPLTEGGQVRGVLVFDRGGSAAGLFSDDDESFALALCEELVALLRTERVLERLDGEHRKIQRIFGAARAFGGVVRVDDAMEHALQAALDLVHGAVPQASAALVEIVRDPSAGGAPGAEQDALLVRRVAGPAAALLACPEPQPLHEESWVGRAILQRTVLPHVALPEAGSDRGLYARDDGRCAGLGDVRAIPLFAQGEPVAALVVTTPKGERLRAAVLDSLVVAADLAGVAIGGARLFETVERQATTDGLTGLSNRRTLDARLAEAIARARRLATPLCVVLTDVDHFKSVNDNYGHASGDEVLKGVARALAGTARASDVVARYGGEEFCLVLEGTDPGGAARLAERMRLAIKGLRFDTDKGPLNVTSSFGVALLGPGDDPHAVLERADQNLYRAKESGRDRVVV